jgi:hypothetical protein
MGVMTTRRATALLAALAALAGCGGGEAEETSAPTVTVQAGAQEVPVDPTQYCLAGEGQRYSTSPPILEVPVDSPITLRVPEVLAADGWSVQVFDDRLEELIGEVAVDPDTPVFTGINASDVAPDAFYLVVVQHRDPDACAGLSGAWPIGFIRSGAGRDGESTTPADPSPADPAPSTAPAG